MKYLYYPGCSLKSTGRAYEESLLAVFRALEIPFEEIEDWNCCGATAYMSVDEGKALALAARNLAIAERQGNAQAGEDVRVVAPCSACFLALSKVQHNVEDKEGMALRINHALGAAGLNYGGRVRIQHPLDVFVNDVGLDKIRTLVRKPLQGLRVASYYGCQFVRPYSPFDDPHDPQTMDRIVEALGGEPVDWPLKTRCCGGSLTGTIQKIGLRLNHILLKEAHKRGADVMITACPLCQFNLECFQDGINAEFGDKISLPVAFFTQLMGVAFGLPGKKIGLRRLFVPLEPALSRPQGGAQLVNT